MFTQHLYLCSHTKTQLRMIFDLSVEYTGERRISLTMTTNPEGVSMAWRHHIRALSVRRIATAVLCILKYSWVINVIMSSLQSFN